MQVLSRYQIAKLLMAVILAFAFHCENALANTEKTQNTNRNSLVYTAVESGLSNSIASIQKLLVETNSNRNSEFPKYVRFYSAEITIYDVFLFLLYSCTEFIYCNKTTIVVAASIYFMIQCIVFRKERNFQAVVSTICGVLFLSGLILGL